MLVYKFNLLILNRFFFLFLLLILELGVMQLLIWAVSLPWPWPHHLIDSTMFVLCDTVSGKMRRNDNSPQIGNQQQPQIRIPPKSNLVNPWVLLELLTGTEMIQRQLQHQRPTPDEWWIATAGTPKLTAWLSGGSKSWKLSFPGSSVGLCPFQEAWPVWDSSRQLR